MLSTVTPAALPVDLIPAASCALPADASIISPMPVFTNPTIDVAIPTAAMPFTIMPPIPLPIPAIPESPMMLLCRSEPKLFVSGLTERETVPAESDMGYSFIRSPKAARDVVTGSECSSYGRTTRGNGSGERSELTATVISVRCLIESTAVANISVLLSHPSGAFMCARTVAESGGRFVMCARSLRQLHGKEPQQSCRRSWP